LRASVNNLAHCKSVLWPIPRYHEASTRRSNIAARLRWGHPGTAEGKDFHGPSLELFHYKSPRYQNKRSFSFPLGTHSLHGFQSDHFDLSGVYWLRRCCRVPVGCLSTQSVPEMTLLA